MRLATLTAALACAANGAYMGVNPVSRVVELLKGLSKKAEEEHDTEEGLYNKFVCWGKTTVEVKTASNEVAKTRTDALKTYIADIEAGRIEFTTERVDLEKEVAELTKDIAQATALRDQEKSDFESAEKEMKQGIAALESAVEVLGEATKDNSLLAVKGKASRLATAQGFAARSAEAAVLSHAVDLGDRVLSKADAHFLRRLLTGDVGEPWYKPKDVPSKKEVASKTVGALKKDHLEKEEPIEKDYKKLNKKSDFKEGYKARSGKIQALLSKMLNMFQNNLDEATKKEDDAQKLFDKLSESKEAQKAAAEEALLTMSKEGGARGLTMEAAQQEVDDLTKQVEDDTKYISQTKDSLKNKKEEWETRSALRMAEIEAITKAIGILHSDDARDLFKKSHQSQGYSLLQLSSRSRKQTRSLAAIFQLRRAQAAAVSDQRVERLIALATRLAASTASKGRFDEVITAIDKMVETLKGEETTELENKEDCEKTRNEDTQDAAMASRIADELTDTKDRLETEIKELEVEIEENKKAIEVIKEEIKSATRNRENEKSAYDAAKVDDEAAVELVKKAKAVLVNFYADNGMMFAQQKQTQQVSAPGDAPPPPPATFEGDYGGQTGGASQGIIAILEMIKNDIKKDIAKGDKNEDTAISDYDTLKADLEQQISDHETSISDLEGNKGKKEEEVQTTMEERTSKVEELKVVMDKIKDEEPGCDFILVNFDVRTKNRQIEVDGLQKAKAILTGASFSF